jgi:hypothetical protein
MMYEMLTQAGKARMAKFCRANRIEEPDVVEELKGRWSFGVCAYYRPTTIHICKELCARQASGENDRRNWNWPGSTTDRTPYGVIAHELGHHCDYHSGGTKGRYSSDYSTEVRKQSGEKPITSYCPNDAEWFAEMFRLFVTNASLLECIRPRTWDIITDRWVPVSADDWKKELTGAVPNRIIKALENKMVLT